MERMARKSEDTEARQSSFRIKCGKGVRGFAELIEQEKRECESESISSYDFLTSGREEEQSHSSEESSSSSPRYSCWGMEKVEASHVQKLGLAKMGLENRGSSMPEAELMKERLSKLLLGEDMSGYGNGVSTALAISNAITNLYATLFGQLWRLEPLPPEKKAMWRREMEWLLCVSDHIVDLVPSWQTFPDGTKLEVMTSRPRSDLYINLPALRKLDNMLLETLDGFKDAEFWYVDQGILAMDADGSSSFRQSFHRHEEKWWLPVPQVPSGGLNEDTRKRLQKKRACTNQILKAAMAINSITLTEIEVPDSYMEALPKNIRATLGDVIYRYITSDQFYPECLLDCLDLSSEHQALEIANRIETSIFMCHRKNDAKPPKYHYRSNSKSSWEMVKELVIDGDKKDLLADRAESLLMCLKQRNPGLPQTTLEMSKIQCNKDVGKAILESYSRVLESLAFNIVARIDDILFVDDLTRHSDEFSPNARVSLIPQKSVSIPFAGPISGTPYKTAFATPNFSPAHVFSPGKGGSSPFLTSGKIPKCGIGAKKVLTDFLSINMARKISGSSIEEFGSIASRSVEASPSPSSSTAEFARTTNV